LLLVGDDWAEDHHDVELQDPAGRRLGRARLPEGVAGIGRLHELVVAQLGEDDGPEQVVVAIETDRGPWVQALLAAGYQVFPVNPRQVARYRERHGTSGAKAMPGTRTRWPTWSAPIGTSCARRPVTATKPRRSSCWPGRTRP
jgi:transposase